METAREVPDALIDHVAMHLRVLGQPVRIKLLNQLEGGSATVQTLSVAVGTSQQNVSRHLLLLYQAGIVSRRQEGVSVWYALADADAVAAIEAAQTAVARRLRGGIARSGGDHAG